MLLYADHTKPHVAPWHDPLSPGQGTLLFPFPGMSFQAYWLSQFLLILQDLASVVLLPGPLFPIVETFDLHPQEFSKQIITVS